MTIRPATLDDIRLVLDSLQAGPGPNWVMGYASLLENAAQDLRVQAAAAKAAEVAQRGKTGEVGR